MKGKLQKRHVRWSYHSPATPLSSLHRSSLWKLQSQTELKSEPGCTPFSQKVIVSLFIDVFAEKQAKQCLSSSIPQRKAWKIWCLLWETPHGNMTLLSGGLSRKRKAAGLFSCLQTVWIFIGNAWLKVILWRIQGLDFRHWTIQDFKRRLATPVSLVPC